MPPPLLLPGKYAPTQLLRFPRYGVAVGAAFDLSPKYLLLGLVLLHGGQRF